jgi:M6 family metalloprotease-like protein
MRLCDLKENVMNQRHGFPACGAMLIRVILLSTLAACTPKNDDKIYSNCKLPIADGRGGVAIGGFPRYSARLPSTGTVNATVLFVDFSDAGASKTPAQAYAMISGATATFTEQSYSKMTYTMTPVLQWFRMSQPSTSYTFSGPGHKSFIQEAVSLADATVDFSTTDSLVIITNPDSTRFSTGPAFTGSTGGGVTADGHEMLNIVTSGNDLNNWGSIWLNHEVTHTLGLVDLYSYTQTSFPEILRDVGQFSYMGYNSFNSNSPGLTAWERWVLGWLDDSQVLCSNPRATGEINTTVTPLGTTGGQKAVVIPVGDTKAIVVESRRASGIDANIAKTGALVYTVDSSVASGYGPVSVFPKGDSSDPYSMKAPRAAGESVTVAGIKVEVISSNSSGDTVRITADKLWVDR